VQDGREGGAGARGIDFRERGTLGVIQTPEQELPRPAPAPAPPPAALQLTGAAPLRRAA